MAVVPPKIGKRTPEQILAEMDAKKNGKKIPQPASVSAHPFTVGKPLAKSLGMAPQQPAKIDHHKYKDPLYVADLNLDNQEGKKLTANDPLYIPEIPKPEKVVVAGNPFNIASEKIPTTLVGQDALKSQQEINYEENVKPDYEYHGETFDKTKGILMSEGDHQAGQYRDRVMVWTTAEGKRVPIPARWHPHSVVKRIIRHNQLGQYTGIVMIGQSGSGKTTLTRKLVHQISCKYGEPYIVKWFNGYEMLHMDEHIKAMQVGTPHILIFDDASYTLEDAKKTDVAKLANALTTIRHTLKSKVIIVMNIHYSKATLKFFRNQHFTFLTSVSVEEMGNYQDLFKDKMHVIRAFGKQYNKMMLKGYFEVPVSSFDKTTIRYRTNEPFRMGLVAEIADLHFMLYDRAECEKCDPKNQKAIWQGSKQPKTIDTILEKMRGMYNVSGTGKMPKSFATVLRFFRKINADDPTALSLSERAMWNHLTNISKAVFNDWSGLGAIVEGERKVKLPKNKQVKVKADASVLEIARAVKKEQEAEMLENPKEYEHYDSTFIGKGGVQKETSAP